MYTPCRTIRRWATNYNSSYEHADSPPCWAAGAGAAELRALCRAKLGGPPRVVAIDINGNRPLEAVLLAVRQTIQPR